MIHPTPPEVLTATNHAQHCLGRTSTPEETESGALIGPTADEDPDPKTTVSLFSANPSLSLFRPYFSTNSGSYFRSVILFSNFQSKTLASDRREKSQEETKTPSGSPKTPYDQANKEYEGTYVSLLLSISYASCI